MHKNLSWPKFALVSFPLVLRRRFFGASFSEAWTSGSLSSRYSCFSGSSKTALMHAVSSSVNGGAWAVPLVGLVPSLDGSSSSGCEEGTKSLLPLSRPWCSIRRSLGISSWLNLQRYVRILGWRLWCCRFFGRLRGHRELCIDISRLSGWDRRHYPSSSTR